MARSAGGAVAKHCLQETRDFLRVLDASVALDPGTYIHYLGSYEAHRLRDRVGREAARENHPRALEPPPGFARQRQIQRHPGAAVPALYPRLHEHRVGLVRQLGENVEVGDGGETCNTPDSKAG